MIYLFYGLLVLLALKAWKYLFAILITRKVVSIPLEREYRPLDLDAFFAQGSADMPTLHEDILASGFDYWCAETMVVDNLEGNYTIYYHRNLRLIANLCYVHADGNIVFTMTQFAQWYQDGSSLVVNNTPMSGPFPELPGRSHFRFPELQDINDLLDATNRLAREHMQGQMPRAFDQETGLQTLKMSHYHETRMLIDKGWVSGSYDEDDRELTLKGATLMVVKQNPLVRYLRESMQLRKSRKALSAS